MTGCKEYYKIFKLNPNIAIELVGKSNKSFIKNPLFSVMRRSISEGIFESELATSVNCGMNNGNIYKLYIDDSDLYIHILDDYAYFGTNIINTHQLLTKNNVITERNNDMENNNVKRNMVIFKLPDDCKVCGTKFTNAHVDEIFLCMNKNTDAANELMGLLEGNSDVSATPGTIYSIEFKTTGGWIHIGITDTSIHIGQCVRVISF